MVSSRTLSIFCILILTNILTVNAMLSKCCGFSPLTTEEESNDETAPEVAPEEPSNEGKEALSNEIKDPKGSVKEKYIVPPFKDDLHVNCQDVYTQTFKTPRGLYSLEEYKKAQDQLKVALEINPDNTESSMPVEVDDKNAEQ